MKNLIKNSASGLHQQMILRSWISNSTTPIKRALAFVCILVFFIAFLLLNSVSQPELALQKSSSSFPSHIFLLETSGASSLNPRQACAVESAARHHRNSSVNIYFSTSDKFNDTFNLLSSLPNINMTIINNEDFFANSPLWEWYQKGEWRNTTKTAYDISDASRLLLVWRFGGVYLDLDIVVLRHLYGIENFLVREGEYTISNGVFGFERNHPFISKCLETFQASYGRKIWGSGGPKLFTNTFKSVCSVSKLTNKQYRKCNVTLLPPSIAYPLPWEKWKVYFQGNMSYDNLLETTKDSYMVHVWNYLSKGEQLSLNAGSLYEYAIRDECPLVYEKIIESTGLNHSFVF